MLAGLVGVVVLGYAIIQFGVLTRGLRKNTETMAVRMEYWSATAKLLADHPLLGVGPGNFGTVYPQYMPATAAEQITDPHNLFLEAWASAGLVGLAGLLLVLGAFLWRQLPLLRDPAALLQEEAPPGQASSETPETPATPPAEKPAEPYVRWEFYVGGAIGLVLSFALVAIGRSTDEIIAEGIRSGGRSILWFMAFALMEGVIWPTRFRSLFLTVGVLALVANLLVSGGIGFPSVAGLLMAALALALNSPLPRPVRLVERYGTISTAVPFPALFALVLVYIVGVFSPTTTAAAYIQASTIRGEIYDTDQNVISIQRKRQVANEPWRGEFNPAFRVLASIRAPLFEAQKADPWDPRTPALIARWTSRMWEVTPIPGTRPSFPDLDTLAIRWAREAQRRDPAGAIGYITEAEVRERMAHFLESIQSPGPFLGNAYRVFIQQRGPLVGSPGTRRADIRQEYRLAAEALKRYQDPHDPNDAPLAYRIAELYAHADDRPGMIEQARRALELNKSAPSGPMGRLRSLSDPQRAQIQRWLGGADSP
jgi:hypothetical protein